MTDPVTHLAVVVPVYRNGATLAELVTRVDATLTGAGVTWTLRLVVDACPEGSAAHALALTHDPRVRVTVLERNVGQHRAIATGLAAEPAADAWACLDGDLQDPPEALVPLLAALRDGADAVFAGRRGAYEGRGRRVTGDVHRRLLAALTGLPPDAGAFLVMGRTVRDRVVARVLDDAAPSVVVAAAGPHLVSLAVERRARTDGESAWTSTARARQSVRTLAWALRHERAGRLGGEIAGFALIGVLGTLAYLTAYAVTRTALPAHPANVLARVGVAVPTTWANGRFTFGARPPWRRLVAGGLAALALGLVITGVPLAGEQTLLGTRHHALELVTLAVATLVATLARFVFLRRWFARAAPPVPAAARPDLVPL